MIDSKIESQKKHIEDMSGNKQQTIEKRKLEIERHKQTLIIII